MINITKKKLLTKILLQVLKNINNKYLITSQKMFFIKQKSLSIANNLNCQLHSSKLNNTSTLILHISKERKEEGQANHTLASKSIHTTRPSTSFTHTHTHTHTHTLH